MRLMLTLVMIFISGALAVSDYEDVFTSKENAVGYIVIEDSDGKLKRYIVIEHTDGNVELIEVDRNPGDILMEGGEK